MHPSQLSIGNAFFHAVRSSWGAQNGRPTFDEFLKLKKILSEWSASPFGLRFKIHLLPDYHAGICRNIRLEKKKYKAKKTGRKRTAPFTGNLVLRMEQRYDEVMRVADRLRQWAQEMKKLIQDEKKKAQPSFPLDKAKETLSIVNDLGKKLKRRAYFDQAKIVVYTLPLIVFDELHWHHLPDFYTSRQTKKRKKAKNTKTQLIMLGFYRMVTWWPRGTISIHTLPGTKIIFFPRPSKNCVGAFRAGFFHLPTITFPC